MRRFILVHLLTSTALLSGCAPFENVTANDIRTPEHAYKQVTLDMTMLQVRKAIFDYQRNCRSIGDYDYDPTGTGRIFIAATAPGATKSSARYVIDLAGTPDGKTVVTSYSYFERDRPLIDKTLDAIKDPTNCII